jgi:hypothetical protein
MCGVACNVGFTMCNGACVAVDPSQGVFAAPGGATSGGCGAQNAPCGTIAAAMAAATAAGKSLVYLASGTYVESVPSSGTTTLQGGWTYLGGGAWQPVCTNASSAAVIQGVNDAAVYVTGGTLTLQTLTLRSKSATSAGESVYGLFSTGGSATLQDVVISVAAGGNGTAGAAGMAGAGGGASCMTGSGMAGGPGSDGAGAVAGTWSVGGYSPNPGVTAQYGFAGQNGPAGTPGKCVTVQDKCVADTNLGCTTAQVMSCGKAGGVGCGGYSGSPGTGGTGGGSSVGVFAWNGEVAFYSGGISTGNGGTGGTGGTGGPGGHGSVGAKGADDLLVVSGCMSHCVLVGGTEEECTCPGGQAVVEGTGGAGSVGGAGGAGGMGGGGAGGDSWCYVQGGGGQISMAAGVTCTPGSGGLGGNQGRANVGHNGNTGVMHMGP